MINKLKLVRDTIIKYRKKKGISQQTLSEIAGLNRSTISRIERGTRNPQYSTILKICLVLDVPIREIFPDA